jgi:hypothetical protein
MKLEFSRQNLEKYSNIKFRENPSSGSQGFPCGQTDKRDEANSRFSQFCEHNKNTVFPANVWMCSLVYHSNGVIEQGTKQKMCP